MIGAFVLVAVVTIAAWAGAVSLPRPTSYASVPAFGKWIKQNSTANPGAMSGVGLVNDPRDGYVLEFGGDTVRQPGPVNNNTWAFVGGNWTKLKTSAPPPPTTYPSLAYDASLQKVVLFEFPAPGSGNNGSPETWEYSRNTWTQVHTSSSPRVGSLMTYDARTKQAVLFGNSYNQTTRAPTGTETWAFDGSNWTLLSATGLRGPKLSTIAYDPAYGTVIGVGRESFENHTVETWALESTSWKKLNMPTHAPSIAIGSALLAGQSMVYDSQQKALVLTWSECDGCYQTGVPGTEHVWAFKNGTWSHVIGTVPPISRWGYGMAYDSSDGYIVQYGGWFTNPVRDFDATWTLS